MRKIRPEDRAGLDLSSWRVAFNGAEPVRLETVNRFAAQFADCGFRREAFVPCYGLAEATLFVSGGLDPNGVTTANQGVNGNSTNGGSGNGAKISRKQDKLLVACGRPPVEQIVRIVSPDSQRQCSADEVGEIWVQGPSVAQGYWRKATETEETFNAQIPETGEGPFLRTGDLGFLKEGHLFITGRLKDLLIIRGQNYYPQDIELTVEQSHPILQPGSGAAFSVEIEGEERLVVVQEVAVRKDPESIVQSDLDELDALIKLISRNIVAAHELQAFAVVLIRKGTIPKTSSGKIQRHACRNAFLNRELYVLREWHERKQREPVLPKPSKAELEGHVPYGLASWLAQEIARIQGIDPERVDLNQPFAAYGLDSLAAIEFAHKLQTEFGVEVEVSEFFGDSTITEVIRRATKNTRSPVRKVANEQAATYPLSYGQRALWFVHRMAPESAAYNISRTFRIKSAVDVGALRDAFQALVDRHPALRTTIVETAGEPLQQVAEKIKVSFEYHEAANWGDAELIQELLTQNRKPFRLAEGPLFRVHLYHLAEKDYVMHVAVHHIVSDLWSLMLLFEELGKLYEQRKMGVDRKVPTCDYTYADFVAWQREQLAGPEGERLWSYWKNELSGELAPLDLPADHPRPLRQTFCGSSYSFVIEHKLCERLRQLGNQKQTTLFVTLFAAFQALLHRLSGQKDIVVGFPTTGRARPELGQVAGYFVSALPLRAKFDRPQSFNELLPQIRGRVLGALSHDLYPFALMVEKLGVARDSFAPPVFQSIFALQTTYGNSEDFVRLAVEEPGTHLQLGDLQLEPVQVPEESALLDVSLTFAEGPHGLSGTWQYNSDLFERSTIARWAESFRVLLEGIVSRPETRVSRLGLLSENDRTKMLEEFNPAELAYDRERCVHQEIERQTKLIPSKTAIAYRSRELSYHELNAQANRVARYLRRRGVGKGDRVGILMRRTPQMVAAMLGVWKAGAGYVPLDPQYPSERLRFMLQDAPPKLVITTSSVRDRVGEIPSKILYVDEEREQIDKESSEDLDEVMSSGQVAYVIYTAGSTGDPRGVMLAHQSAMSLVAWAKSAFRQEELEGVLAAASIGSDLSIFELWATLSCGGTVVLARDLMDWWEHIDDEDPHPVRLINTLPSAMTKLLQQGSLPKSVLTVNLTGEVLNTALVNQLTNQLTQAGALKRVNNLYGQSETTTYSTWTTVGAGEKVTVGRAVANTQLYVLDEEMQLVPGGVAGELYVGGDGLALGYLKNFRLTAERFLPNPFSQGNGSRMYRTGDMARWQDDGQLEYLSRADQQVRLGGYRIQLEEIEAAVLDHAGVSQAVVVVRVEQTGVKRLLGYVAGRGKKIDVGQLRGYLQQRLLEYMVPSAFQQLDSLPLTPNGKIDRKALAEMENGETIAETGAPVLTSTEELISGVWSSLLGKSNIGRDDNFFGLGGHSLLVTQVISRIREVFQVELPMQVMFESPTVAGLARSIESSTRIEAPPLRRRSRQERIPLSFGQERLRFLSRYELETSLYNVPIAVRLRGALNIEAAKASLQEMVNRHEVLRTSFPEVGDSTIQDIAAEMEVPFAAAEIREDELDEVLREQARRSFDLSHGPLIRASLFHIGSQDHVLLVVMHHIVSDGWSLGVMLREFNVLYDSFSRGAASPLPPLAIQYADYSEWQREWLQGEVLERQLDYWRKQLAGHETLNLPTDRPHSAKPTLAGAMERSRLPESLVSKLKLLSDQQGVTLFMTLLAGFEILLYRYTGQTDISVGSGIANRNRQELEPLIGFFVNTLVLRTQFTEDSSVAELLQRVREVSLQAYAHQDIPFERLVEALDPVRELSRTPFFQALFVLQNAPLPKVSWNGLEATASILETGTAKFDLTLSAYEEDGGLELSLEYRTELFNAERMKRLLQHYRTLLEGIAVSVDARIGELEILSEAERQQLLVEWNGREAAYSTDKCVHQWFEEQAAKTPQAVAVIDEDGQISYGELNRSANQLAHYLAKLGVGPEVRVGIGMERGLEMLVGVLGVLKAGGVYVPLDPADPSARRSYMVKDAGAGFVLTNERFTQQMAGCTDHGVDLEEAREEIEKQSGDNLRLHLDTENLAWVIYTSSSTGRPKGTAIPHGSAVSRLQRTVIDAMDQNPSVERWLNLYAPTEDTTYATYAEVKHDEQGTVTIGQSQSNTQAYVLDKHMKLVPVGIKGELYLGGAAQARGYLNRPELTAEQFVPNPFGQTSGGRLYRTGDLVRYQENGNLEFLGRLDDQVKIQGYRIEPGEIEAAVLEYSGITQAAVVAREDKLGEMRLIGYVAGSERLDVDRLRSHLQQRVPEYMVPAALLQLDTLPLTPNGKVDRKALLELESKKAMEEAGSLALTPTEELIAGVWSSLLGKSDIRRDDNFFDLGGHSLMVTQMLSRLRQVFNREIDLRAMFESLILKDLATYIDQLTGSTQQTAAIPRVDRKGKLALSYGQERLWFIDQLEPENVAYNVPGAVRIQGPLDVESLKRALRETVRRHESLRTRFVSVDGEPQQIIDASVAVEVPVTELSHLAEPEREAEARRLALEDARQPFDLARGPLFRVKLLRLASQDHVLVFTMHHIVTDGWSWGILVREISAIYNNFSTGQPSSLPELDIQYADFSAWQREFLSDSLLEKQLEYWKRKLAGVEPLTLPTDKLRPPIRRRNGATAYFTLPIELTEGLKHLGREQGATVYMTMLAAFQALLGRYSRQYDIAVGSPIAGRSRSELEMLIGCFINTLVLRTDLSGEPDSIGLLQRVKETTLEAYAHQDVPFEKLVEVLVPQRDLARSPLFQVMFILQNMPWSELQMGGAKMLPFEVDAQSVQFELSLFLAETDTGMKGWIPYSTDLFEAATITRMVEHYSLLLTSMVSAPHAPIHCLEILSPEERRMLLEDFNATAWSIPETTVTRLFEEQVGRTPNAGAVQCGEDLMSYIELDQRANQLAHYLKQIGVGHEMHVGICLNRSLDMVVALLGVLKSGGAYVPLDPSYPVDRLGFMLEDAQIPVLVTESSLRGILPVTMAQIISMDEDWKDISASSVERVEGCVDNSNLAYVIYTSGSTGRPKGVAVEHRQLVNYIQTIGEKLQIEVGRRLGLISTYAADLGYTMIFPALCYGGCLNVVDVDLVLDVGKLEEHFSRHPMDYLKIVPSHLRALLNSSDGNRLLPRRWLVLGGEASTWELIQQVKDRGAGCRVLNHYGPTETTVGVLTYDTTPNDGKLQAGGMVPLGRPLSNGKAYVLDDQLNPVGVGMRGEIYIGGAGVARGYLNRSELTAEKFLPDPYCKQAGRRMYRTGDLGRHLENGNIEFGGRKDHQVKVRGFRVELGEIETALVAHAKVREAVVLAQEDGAGSKQLVAYLVPERAGENGDENTKAGLQINDLREHLLGKLPEYMVPSAYVQLEKLPLTRNGKLDRDSLPAAGTETAEREFVGPGNPIEEILCRIWQEVLRRERVAIHDNFFTLGGHSLLAVQVAARMRDSFKVDIPIRALFEAPTVAQMAKYIAQVNGHDREQSSPILVSIQPQGSRTPFFFVHAISGQVISYAGLSQELGPEQPFYGLQSPPADLFPDADTSIEAMARLYIHEIQSVQPRGPYLLGGWSMGGLVAWEMAQQLVKQGETIRLLALIDTTPPSMNQGDGGLSMLARFAVNISQLVGQDPQPLAEQFSQLTPQGQWNMVQEALTNYDVLTTETAHAEMTALLDVFTRNFNAINNYVTNNSNQPVIFFRAADTPEHISRLWTTWACGGLQFHSVPGNHFTILRQPSVRIISDLLQEYVLNAGEQPQQVATVIAETNAYHE
jgi:amino acid adenylation domain-containing protein